jgi:hypothetical protein
MKTLVAFAFVLFAASQLPAQTADKPTVITPADLKQADPKAPAAPAPAKKEVKKPEPEPVIPGVTITRPDGTFLGLEVSGGNFKLSFYDKKKKPAPVDVSRATARWPNIRSPLGDNRTVLNPSGNALVGSKPVIPPYTFIVRLTLLKGDGDDAKAVENYTVQFRG